MRFSKNAAGGRARAGSRGRARRFDSRALDGPGNRRSRERVQLESNHETQPGQAGTSIGLVGWRIRPWRVRVWDTASSTWRERVKPAGLDQLLACGDPSHSWYWPQQPSLLCSPVGSRSLKSDWSTPSKWRQDQTSGRSPRASPTSRAPYNATTERAFTGSWCTCTWSRRQRRGCRSARIGPGGWMRPVPNRRLA